MLTRLEIIRRLYRNRVVARKKNYAKVFPERYKKYEDTLLKDGIVVIPNFWSDEVVDEVRTKICRFMDEISLEEWQAVAEECKNLKRGWGSFVTPFNVKLWSDDKRSDQRIFYSERLDENIRLFGEDKDFLEMAKCITLKDSVWNTTLFNRTQFISGNKGSGGGWHRDGIYSHGFKSLLYLTDVSDKNGPFQYIPRSFHWSHHLLYAKHVDQYQYSEEEIEDLLKKRKKYPIKTITGTKGTLVVFNTNGIHRGKPIEEGERCAITNYFK